MQVISINSSKRFVLLIVTLILTVIALSLGQFDSYAAAEIELVETTDEASETVDSLKISSSQSINVQFGESYSVDDLTDKKAIFAGQEVAGSWQLSDDSLTQIGQYEVVLTFTADDSQYGKAEQTINLNILPGPAKKVLIGEPDYTTIEEAGKTLADAALNVGTIGPVSGQIAFDQPLDTVVEANVAYSWTFSADDEGYLPLSGEIILFVKSEEEQPAAEDKTADQSVAETAVVLDDYQDYFDVKANTWYYDAVKYVSQHKVMQGVSDEMFLPSDETTRAMLLTILHRLSGEPKPARQDNFSDVQTGFWYSEPINWGAEQSIANGVGDNMFKPSGNLTREQLVVALYRYAQLNNYDVTAESDLTDYDDADNLSDWARQSMRWAVENKILTGTSETTLSPRAGANRAQMATVLQRFMQKYVK